MDQPMSPGNKVQPIEPISKVAWNPRVQHILATTAAGHCTIWDLRRSDPVVHLTKAMCQFEPHLMAWSPDVATRLCLADPAHPSADVQLWDLRYPKHALALLARWPPSSSGPLGQAALGNAGTINAMAWSPSAFSPTGSRMRKFASQLNDSDLVAVYLTASGALPTPEGGCGTGLEPTSADFLVIWSVEEALRSVQTDSAAIPTSRQPLFVGRLEDGGSEMTQTATSLNGIPSNASVHWLPTQPGLLSVTQSDGWINVINLCAGVDPTTSVRSGRTLQTMQSAHISRARHASHKVAEAFGEEVDLSSSSTPALSGSHADSVTQATTNGQITDGVHLDWDYGMDAKSHTRRFKSLPRLPQPLPRLRLAPRWMKVPCGANFAFGGRLVSFSLNRELTSGRARSPPNQSHTALSSSSDIVSGVSSMPSRSPSGTDQARIVQLQWIDATDMQPIAGLLTTSPSYANMTELMHAMIDWLYGVVSHASPELADVCDRLKQVCRPLSIRLSADRCINPWMVLQARLHSGDQLQSVVPGLLGFDEQTVRSMIDQALSAESPVLPSELHCLCQSKESQDVAFLHLSALKLALVTADSASTIRLCLHSTLSALPCPGISPLSALSVLLCAHFGQNELYTEVQQHLLSSLDRISSLGGPHEALRRCVTLLLTGLLQGDWTTVISQWPLDDWPTALVVIINHAGSHDQPLFRHLCTLLLDRLIDNTIESSLCSDDRYGAAWICAVLAGSLDGLIRVWCEMNALTEREECRGAQLLPLVLQLLLLKKCYPMHDSSRPIEANTGSFLSVPQLFASVALWLGQLRSGRTEQDIFVALRLLQDYTIDQSATVSPEMNEIMHRLWCGLSPEQQQQYLHTAQSPLQFYCPFQQSTVLASTKPCPCGKSLWMAVDSAHLTTTSNAFCATPPSSPFSRTTSTHPRTDQPRRTVGPSGRFVVPPVDTPNMMAPCPAGSDVTTRFPSVPMFTPGADLPSKAPIIPLAPVPPPPVHSTLPDPSFGSWPPLQPVSNVKSQLPFASAQLSTTGGTSPLLPPPPSDRLQPPSFDITSAPSLIQTAVVRSGDQNPLNFASSVRESTLYQSSSATGRAWNDPPLLARTYQTPTQPLVSVNQYYDPSQYTSQPGAPPCGFTSPLIPPHTIGSAQVLHPPSLGMPCPMPAPLPPGTSVFPKSLRPEHPNLLVPPLLGASKLPPPVPSGQLSYATLHSCMPSSISQQPTGISSQANYSFSSAPSQSLQPVVTSVPLRNQPLLGDERFGGETNRGSNMSSRSHPTGYPGLATERWPAAEPLGIPSPPPLEPTHADRSRHISGENPNHHMNGVVSGTGITTESPMAPINSECEAVQNSLTRLIHLCRSVGGKPYMAKMDLVERRLSSLFALMRTGQSGSVLLSDVVWRHLLDCVEAAQRSDYNSAVTHANLLIQSATGFESIHDFAPGLKILMQSARQLFPATMPSNTDSGGSFGGQHWPVGAM
ncbi:hypothetical protein PHET_04006 [Paragonimus heterotremus]|uniref:Protein transport protein Sec31A n=1 Tax=Paragonimus heterotremus TaxID=100268 RepID=A0A8J4TCL3_9TREM|nr:hypothetical protein PHET_04006 [Paragonimus heterotremus]